MTIIRDALDYLFGKVPSPVPTLAIVRDPNGLGAQVALRNDYSMKRLDGPSEPRPNHVFTDASRFVAWLLREAEHGRITPADCDILVSPTVVVANADPNALDAYTVSCALDKDPAWRKWESATTDGKWLSDSALFDLVREVAHTIEGRNATVNGENVLVSVADELLSSLQNLEVSESGKVEIKRDHTGLTTFTGTTGKTATNGKFPPEFTIRLPVFQADPYSKVATQIILTTRKPKGGDAKLEIRLTAPRMEEALLEAQRHLADKMRRELGDDWLVCMGTHRTATVPLPPVID